MARKINKIFVHCTASRQSWTVSSLLKEFTAKGWHYPGYHWVVTADGKCTQLMTEDKPSNGVFGHNFDSINVAYMYRYVDNERVTIRKNLKYKLFVMIR